MLRRFLCLTLFLLPFLFSCEKSSPASRWNVLLISLDTTRADHLGCYGQTPSPTPHIDALAAQGVLFERAYTPVPITLPAHTSLMTGALPPRHRVRINGSFDLLPSIPTLAETLKKTGYQTAAVVGAFPLLARFGLERGFDSYDDAFPYRDEPVRVRHHERKAIEVVDRAQAWLAQTASQDTPWFLWLHFFDPHDPYEPPAPWNRGPPESRYQGEIAYVDRELGRLFGFLDGKKLRNRTVIILCGDHGEALGGHGEITHSYFVYDETVRVPLIVSAPEIGPRRHPEAVSLIDVVPTLVELLGLPSAPADGVSLVPALMGRSASRAPVYTESLLAALEYGFAPLTSLRSGKWKYIEAPVPELFDLEQDPGETRNLAEEHPEVLRRLRERLAKRQAAFDGTPAPGGAPDPEIRDRLRSLGYTHSGAPIAGDAGSPDPKAMLPLYLEVKAAVQTAEDPSRLPEAIDRLEAIRSDFAGSLLFHVELGSLYYRQQQVDAALSEFQTVLKIDPFYVNALVNAGSICFEQKRYAEAVLYFERVLEVDPQKWEVYVNLAIAVARTRGDRARVESLLETALTLDLPPLEEKRARSILTRIRAAEP